MVGAYLKGLRVHLGLSIRKLAERMGVSHSMVAGWEDGTFRLYADQLDLFLDAVDASPEQRAEALRLAGERHAAPQSDTSDDRAPVTSPPGLAAGASSSTDSDAVTAPTDTADPESLRAAAPGSAAPGRRSLSTPAADVSGRCTRCAGTGQVDGDDCAACESTGRIVAA